MARDIECRCGVFRRPGNYCSCFKTKPISQQDFIADMPHALRYDVTEEIMKKASELVAGIRERSAEQAIIHAQAQKIKELEALLKQKEII